MEATNQPDHRLCKACNEVKPSSAFHRKSNGYFRCYCAKCTNDKLKGYKKAKATRDPEYAKKFRSWSTDSAKRIRKSLKPADMARFILQDSRRDDKKSNRDNDLDKDFVIDLVSQPCTYCGETELRMTADRINNDLGHTKANVVGACLRCNMARGAMPYTAWVYLVPGVRAAREAGAFGTWTGKIERGSRKTRVGGN